MTPADLLIYILLPVAVVLLVIVAGLLFRLLRLREAGAARPVLTPEALTESERRMTHQFAQLRQGTDAVNALQRRELKDALDGMARVLTEALALQTRSANDGIAAVRSLVSEKVPGEVGRTVGARFEADFGKVKTMLGEVRAGLESVAKLGTGITELHGSMGQFTRLLSNVKARGTWGEWQLGKLLADMMAPGQYAMNVMPNPRSRKIVEYAIALPGNGDESVVWLPVDSKFPQEDYLRLLQASDNGDKEAEAKALRGLTDRVKGFAKDVRDAYILPPYTTDFAILYLPTEGLYLELVRQPDVVETLQRQFKILLAGPTSLAGLINALSMGFRTLAVQKNTVKALSTLRRVKGSLDKFRDLLTSLDGNLSDAQKHLHEGFDRIDMLDRALKSVVTDPALSDHPSQSDATEELSNA